MFVAGIGIGGYGGAGEVDEDGDVGGGGFASRVSGGEELGFGPAVGVGAIGIGGSGHVGFVILHEGQAVGLFGFVW